MINALNNTRTHLTATAAVAAIIGLSACGGSTEQSTADTTVATPVAETVEAEIIPADDDSITEATVAAATPVAEQALSAPTPTPAPAVQAVALPDTGQVIPASSPDLPCTSYVEATELPLHACSSGQLVADFQAWADYVSMDVDVDGYFGQATHDAVIDFQRQFGLVETGIIDQVLMDTLADRLTHEEPVDDEQYTEVVLHAGDEPEGEIHDIAMGQYCQELADGFHPDAEITIDVIDICESLDIRLTSGD